MSESNKILNDIRAYVRLSAAASAKTSAQSIIDTYEKGLMYCKLDGQVTQVKLEQTIKIPQSTINRWLDCFLEGRIIAPPDEFYPGYRALFTLQELEIKIDALKKRAKKEVAAPNQKENQSVVSDTTTKVA